MIAGHLQIKNDYYYMVLSYLDANGKRKQPWFPTGLPIKNNKKRAEKMLLELRQTYVPPAEHKSNGELSADMLFADFMELWLEVVRNSIEKTTFSSYTQMVKGKIAPYFRKTGVKLGELQARHIQSFYLYELKTVSASTVIHEHQYSQGSEICRQDGPHSVQPRRQGGASEEAEVYRGLLPFGGAGAAL